MKKYLYRYIYIVSVWCFCKHVPGCSPGQSDLVFAVILVNSSGPQTLCFLSPHTADFSSFAFNNGNETLDGATAENLFVFDICRYIKCFL